MFKQIIFTGVLMAAFVNANAQSASAPFGVTGTITPGACSVTLTGGQINLGTLSAATVKGYPLGGTSSGVYQIPPVNTPISITCGAPTKVEVSFVDNRPGKTFLVDGSDPVRFGMVDGAGTTGIGSYQLRFLTASTTIDNVAVGQYLSAPNGTTTWSTTTAGTAVPSNFGAPGYMVGFAKVAGATTPDSFTTLTGTLEFKSFVSVNYVNNATTAIALNGSGTLTLVYL